MEQAVASVTVSVDKIISERGGGVIFRGADVHTGKPVTVVVPYDENPCTPSEGEVLYVEGEWKWWEPGKIDQLHAGLIYPVKPSNEYIVDYLARSKRMRGLRIGPKTAAELWQAFKENLIIILNNGDVDSLMRVLKHSQAEALISRWTEYSHETEVVGWLQQNGLDANIASKYIRWGKRQSLSLLKGNPYRLVAFIGSGRDQWQTLDKACQKLGIADDSQERLVAAVEHALYSRHDYGHTRSDFSDLQPMLLRRLGNTSLVSKALQAAIDTGKVIQHKQLGGVQHCGVARMEAHASQRLRSMIAIEHPVQPPLFPIRITDERLVDLIIAEEEARLGFGFVEEQVRAVKMAASQPVSALLGGAGCGKTAAVGAIYRTHEMCGIPVYQMALAGRAAQRLRSMTGRNAWTITGFNLAVASKRLCIAPGSFFIVDESSMLDICTTIRILRCLPHGCRILFVGDPYQLGPIGMGLVLHVLANDLPKDMVTELTEIQRSREETGIHRIARNIRNGIVPDIPDYDRSIPGVSFLSCPLHADRTPEALFKVCAELNELYLERNGQSADCQILSMIKDGPAGVHAINAFFQHHKGTARDKIDVGGRSFYVGDPVMYLVNDYELGLYNGSFGVITEIGEEDGDARLSVAWDDGEARVVNGAQAENMSLAYSATVHKYQGSQCGVAIVPVYENGVIDRTAVYTAMSRGIDQVVFVGSRDVFKKAVLGMPRSHQRKIGFMLSAYQMRFA